MRSRCASLQKLNHHFNTLSWDYRGLFGSSTPACLARISVRDSAGTAPPRRTKPLQRTTQRCNARRSGALASSRVSEDARELLDHIGVHKVEAFFGWSTGCCAADRNNARRRAAHSGTVARCAALRPRIRLHRTLQGASATRPPRAVGWAMHMHSSARARRNHTANARACTHRIGQASKSRSSLRRSTPSA